MWAFYRNESEGCASSLSSLHDTSASLRHQLHRKLGGAVEELVGNAAAAASDHHGGGDTTGSPPASSPGAVSLLLDDADLQYRGTSTSTTSPVVSTGGVLRPTPQVGWVWFGLVG